MNQTHRDYLYKNNSYLAQSRKTNVANLFRHQVKISKNQRAVVDGDVILTYQELNQRVNRLAHFFQSEGLLPGDRVAILASNRYEYIEAELAAAKTGVILCALNCRLVAAELTHCIDLVTPKLLIVEDEFAAKVSDVIPALKRLSLDKDYHELMLSQAETEPGYEGDPEDGLVVLYTSGTTGLPKGALISHRAMIARAAVFQGELGVTRDDGFIAWAPFYHMASTDQSLATLLMGGTVFVVEGYQGETILDLLEREQIGWLVLIPGMIDAFIKDLKARAHGFRPKKVSCVGAMADLVPPHQLQEVTRLLDAPYVNSFGSTETGLPPATSSLLAVGERPASLAKRLSKLCEVQLVDEADTPVPVGTPGELTLRGPTLFSGYWNAHDVNEQDFRGGWFHMGDVFRQHEDGRVDFVDRAKYLIKSGGENIYPAEIERVLFTHPHVVEATVVKQKDTRWGETPVAYVATSEEVSEQELLDKCRQALAAYKCPKVIYFIPFEAFPRSTAGKVQRHYLEKINSASQSSNEN